MSDPAIRTTIEELLAVEPATCDRDGLARIVQLTERARSWLAAVEVQVARRGRQLATAGASESPEEVLSARGRRSGKDAKAADARAEVCESLPGFVDALAAGSVSTGHVDALANATRGLDADARQQLVGRQAELIGLAAALTVSAFERRCRDLARRLDRDEGEKRLDEMKRRSNARRWIDRTCGHPRCQVPFDDCRIHHVIPWEVERLTDLANLLQRSAASTTTSCTRADGDCP